MTSTAVKQAIKEEIKEIEEELLIHTALEEAGALPKHHHDVHHGDLHNKSKKKNRDSSFWFIVIGYSIIALEVFYLYKIVKPLMF